MQYGASLVERRAVRLQSVLRIIQLGCGFPTAHANRRWKRSTQLAHSAATRSQAATCCLLEVLTQQKAGSTSPSTSFLS